MKEPITIETYVHAPLEQVWTHFNDPESVTKWNAASSDWHSPEAENDLRVGGTFHYRMEVKDGSAGFDFEGTYTALQPQTYIAYEMSDGRKVEERFIEDGSGVRVVITFDPETENPIEMQRAGWQSILDNFKKYVESV